MKKIYLVLGILIFLSVGVIAFGSVIDHIEPKALHKFNGDAFYVYWINTTGDERAFALIPRFETQAGVSHITFSNNGDVEIFTSEGEVTINGRKVCMEDGANCPK